MTKPYLSVVIVGRNDDYGDNFLRRINTFVRSLDHQVRNHPGVFELIVVEWNPLSDKEPLAKVLIDTKHLPVRVITVDNQLHTNTGSPNPVLEFHGKNVGIRRARGEFVLTTNPDILFSQQLIDELARKKLRLDTVYRTDRYDFYPDGIENVESSGLIDFAMSKTFVMHGMSRIVDVGMAMGINDTERTLDSLPKSTVNEKIMHTNASGDFILAAKETFFTIRGLYETVEHRWHVDSISLYRFQVAKIKQHVFLAPFCIFHQHHKRGSEDISWGQVKARDTANKLGHTSWGLANQSLPEIIKEPA